MDPDDPTVIAENELLSAASSIEAAAKKLAQLKPRQAARVSEDWLGSLTLTDQGLFVSSNTDQGLFVSSNTEQGLFVSSNKHQRLFVSLNTD